MAIQIVALNLKDGPNPNRNQLPFVPMRGASVACFAVAITNHINESTIVTVSGTGESFQRNAPPLLQSANVEMRLAGQRSLVLRQFRFAGQNWRERRCSGQA